MHVSVILKRLGVCVYHGLLIAVIGWLVLRDQQSQEKMRLLKDEHNSTVAYAEVVNQTHKTILQWVQATQKRLDHMASR